jgi:hypothetical protein
VLGWLKGVVGPCDEKDQGEVKRLSNSVITYFSVILKTLKRSESSACASAKVDLWDEFMVGSLEPADLARWRGMEIFWREEPHLDFAQLEMIDT